MNNLLQLLLDEVAKNVQCQEASPLSTHSYVPCDKPATFLVDNGDQRPYLMCGLCAHHNVQNRGAKILAKVEKV
jgi:hypothetical protein